MEAIVRSLVVLAVLSVIPPLKNVKNRIPTIAKRQDAQQVKNVIFLLENAKQTPLKLVRKILIVLPLLADVIKVLVKVVPPNLAVLPLNLAITQQDVAPPNLVPVMPNVKPPMALAKMVNASVVPHLLAPPIQNATQQLDFANPKLKNVAIIQNVQLVKNVVSPLAHLWVHVNRVFEIVSSIPISVGPPLQLIIASLDYVPPNNAELAQVKPALPIKCVRIMSVQALVILVKHVRKIG